MTEIDEKIKIEEQIKDLEKQIKDLEDGLALEDDLVENEVLYKYLSEQKKYQRIEERAKNKLEDIQKIKESELVIQRAEKKLQDIQKINELRAQLGNLTEK